MKKILVVGDSLSKGVTFDEDKKKYTLLKDSFFNLLSGNINAEMYNASKFGSTITQGEKLLESKLEKIDPDIVVLEFGGNDCDFAWDDIAMNPMYDHIPKTPLDVFEKCLNGMIDLIEEKGKKPVLTTLPPLYADSYFAWFTNNDKEKGLNILKWLKDVWHIYWWQERYSNCLQFISRKRSVSCIDVRREFLKEKDFERFVCSDGIHPNPEGHRLIFEAVLAFIREQAAYLLPASTPEFSPAF
jgi:lysophospholipase L1-like esterase